MENTFTAGVAAFLLLFALCRYTSQTRREGLISLFGPPQNKENTFKPISYFYFPPYEKTKQKRLFILTEYKQLRG